MIEDLAALSGLTVEFLTIGFIVFLRVGGTMALLPALGEQSVPARVRLFLALGFTAIVAPAMANTISLNQLQNSLGHLVWTEPVIGLGFGIVLRLMVMVLQMAGSIAAQATSLAQIFGAAGTDPQPAIGHVLMIAGLALAVMAGLHVRVAEGLIMSYEVFPIGTRPEADAYSEWGISRVAQAFSFAFTLAAPFVIVSLLYNVALGVINRAMPQLMVAFVGAPAITAGGLILLLLTTPILLPIWKSAFEATLHDPFGGW